MVLGNVRFVVEDGHRGGGGRTQGRGARGIGQGNGESLVRLGDGVVDDRHGEGLRRRNAGDPREGAIRRSVIAGRNRRTIRRRESDAHRTVGSGHPHHAEGDTPGVLIYGVSGRGELQPARSGYGRSSGAFQGPEIRHSTLRHSRGEGHRRDVLLRHVVGRQRDGGERPGCVEGIRPGDQVVILICDIHKTGVVGTVHIADDQVARADERTEPRVIWAVLEPVRADPVLAQHHAAAAVGVDPAGVEIHRVINAALHRSVGVKDVVAAVHGLKGLIGPRVGLVGQEEKRDALVMAHNRVVVEVQRAAVLRGVIVRPVERAKEDHAHAAGVVPDGDEVAVNVGIEVVRLYIDQTTAALRIREVQDVGLLVHVELVVADDLAGGAVLDGDPVRPGPQRTKPVVLVDHPDALGVAVVVVIAVVEDHGGVVRVHRDRQRVVVKIILLDQQAGGALRREVLGVGKEAVATVADLAAAYREVVRPLDVNAAGEVVVTAHDPKLVGVRDAIVRRVEPVADVQRLDIHEADMGDAIDVPRLARADDDHPEVGEDGAAPVNRGVLHRVLAIDDGQRAGHRVRNAADDDVRIGRAAGGDLDLLVIPAGLDVDVDEIARLQGRPRYITQRRKGLTWPDIEVGGARRDS